MSLEFFDPIDPAEAVVLTFDFSKGLDAGETLSGAITVSISMNNGVDATPALLQAGAATFNGDATAVLVPVVGRVEGAQYAIKVASGTTNPQKRLAKTGVLPVEVQ